MELDRLGIHESTSIDFPFEDLADELAGTGVEVVPVDDDPATLADCDAVVTFDHREPILESEPDWVHTTQAGVDGFPVEAYEERGIRLTNSTGLHGDRVGETALGLMLMLARRLHAFVENQVDHVWEFPDWDEAFTLTGETVCVVGLGTVGSAVARKADAVGMDVVGVRRSEEPVPGVDRRYGPDELHEAVADARFVVLAVPLAEATRELVDESVLASMGPESYLVNVARGEVVDEAALLAALREGSLAGAALDVFATEPLPADSPFWELDDVIVTPHAAVADRSFYRDVAALVRENVDRLRSGEALTNRVV